MRRVDWFVIALLLGLNWGCTSARDPWAAAKPGQPHVLASFPPLYCFAHHVAGDHASVQCVTTGINPHDFDPTPRDALRVAGADLLFINGLELDNLSSEKLVKLSRNRKVHLESLGEEIDHELLEHMHEHDHDQMEKDGHHHHHGEHDPHIWLGTKQAEAMVNVIAKKLGERDPANKDAYAKNAADYVEKIRELDAYGKEQFKGKKNKTFIATHESLRYFAKSFGLDLVDTIQPQPGIEADAGKLARLVDVCKKKNVAAIAVEPDASRGQAENLARALREKGIAIQIVEVDPMETAPPTANGNPNPDLYLNRMKQNIDNLAKALP